MISKKQWEDAVEEFDKIEKQYKEVKLKLAKLGENELADNCSLCGGDGIVEDGYGDLAHNPYGSMLYRECRKCNGKGYIE